MDELELALRRRMTQFLEGGLQLGELSAWLGTEAWNIDARASAAAAQLYHDAELLLAEHAHGDWTESELKDLLAPLAAYIAVEADKEALVLSAEAGNNLRHSLVFTATQVLARTPLSSLIPALNSIPDPALNS